MVSAGQIRAVNPLHLARVSGVTKIPRYAGSPIPPVIRPQLLTTALRGPQCDHCAGLGYIPPDYGTLRGNGNWGLWKMYSSGMGKHEADFYGTRSYSHGLRGLGQAVPTASPVSNVIVQATQAINTASGAGTPGSNTISLINSVAAGVAFIPGIGGVASGVVGAVGGLVSALKKWIGTGRQEADIIVQQAQNPLAAQLGTITQQFLTGMSVSASQLNQLYTEVWMLGVIFQEFVLAKSFTDRRASGQALNTIMPIIDGTCGYSVPLGMTAYPGSHNCLSWGDGTLGGAGTDGMLGALSRAIKNAGGTPPILPDLHQAANSGIPAQQAAAQPIVPGTGGTIASLATGTIGGIPILYIGIGLAVLWMFSGGGGGGYKSRKVVTTDIF